MDSFPLYDILREKENKIIINSTKKKKIITFVKSLDIDKLNEIFLLIISHHKKMGGGINDDLFHSVINQQDVNGFTHYTFDLDKFPMELQHILYQYMLMH